MALSATDDKVGSRNGDLFIRGFVSGNLVFCVGAMAIMGALESGLTGNHTTLFIKSIIDGITATVLAFLLWGLELLFPHWRCLSPRELSHLLLFMSSHF